MCHLTGLPADAEAVRAAGWDDWALLHDAVSVCALFNLRNRLVDGLGVAADPEYADLSGRRLAEGGYAGLRDLLSEPPRSAGATPRPALGPQAVLRELAVDRRAAHP